jgi:SPP1 family predicted phage head-tail adaptor
MKSERLDRRITIEQQTETIDGYGQRVKTWSVLNTCWASVVLNIGRQIVASQNIVTERTVDFKIRYRTDLNLNMRIIYNDTYYNIEDINELGREDGLMIKTTRLWQT